MGLRGYYRPNNLQPALFVEYLFSFILNDKQKHIVVVGAGPGGLTAAMLLGARGFRVTLVEKDSKAILGSVLKRDLQDWLAAIVMSTNSFSSGSIMRPQSA